MQAPRHFHLFEARRIIKYFLGTRSRVSLFPTGSWFFSPATAAPAPENLLQYGVCFLAMLFPWKCKKHNCL